MKRVGFAVAVVAVAGFAWSLWRNLLDLLDALYEDDGYFYE